MTVIPFQFPLSGPETWPDPLICLRCSQLPEPGSDYCETCNRLREERKADDLLRAAGLNPVTREK